MPPRRLANQPCSANACMWSDGLIRPLQKSDVFLIIYKLTFYTKASTSLSGSDPIVLAKYTAVTTDDFFYQIQHCGKWQYRAMWQCESCHLVAKFVTSNWCANLRPNEITPSHIVLSWIRYAACNVFDTILSGWVHSNGNGSSQVVGVGEDSENILVAFSQLVYFSLSHWTR